MKTSIWVRNLNDNLFELGNTAEHLFELGNTFMHTGQCKEFDLICYSPHIIERTLRVIHEGSSKEETLYIIKFLNNKLYEKSQLLQQVGALKRMKNDSIKHVIEDVKKDIRNNYFEFSIKDILNNYNV